VFGGKVASVGDSKAKAIKGVRQVVRLADAVAVVADHMWAAKQGLAALEIRWDEGPNAKLSTLRFRLMMNARSGVKRPQASEGEAQHGLFCWTRCIGQGDECLHPG
jgi:hypothetical protein